MKMTFLGTQAMQPTRERGLSSIHLTADSESWLIDCGEGTQRQMKIAGIKPTKLTKIFISHFHADHVLGLAGLMRNLSANEYKGVLHIYGPKGLPVFFDHLLRSSLYIPKVKVRLVEIKPGKIVETERLIVEAFRLFHSVESLGFVVQEKAKRKINPEVMRRIGLVQHPLLGELQRGKDIVWKGKKVSVKKATFLVAGRKYVFIQDTGFDKKLVKYAKGADLLVCESTFESKDEEKARECRHLTAGQAGMIAKKGKVKRLIVTHFSQRYADLSQMRKDARKAFPKAELAEDFMTVEV